MLALDGPLNRRQMSTAPWRWRLLDAAVISGTVDMRSTTSARKSLEAVMEVDALVEGRSESYEARYVAAELMSLWRQHLVVDHYYGAARCPVAL